MSNESIYVRPVRIIPAATTPGDAPPDQARSARFRSLMTAVSAFRPDENGNAQGRDGKEVTADNEGSDAPAAATESAPPAALLAPPRQADEPTSSDRDDTDPPMRRESVSESDTAPGAETGAQHGDIHALPLAGHANGLEPNHRIAANRARSFSVRGNRPLAPRTAMATDSRPPPADTSNDDNTSRLDLLAAHVLSLSNFTRATPEGQAITIKLDPKILDDTTLHLAISRSRLSLRFQSSVPASRALIYAHADGLAARLELRTRRPTSIEVTA